MKSIKISFPLGLRTVHWCAALFNLTFVYTPLHDWPFGLPIVQLVTMPLLVLTGFVLMRLRRNAHRVHPAIPGTKQKTPPNIAKN